METTTPTQATFLPILKYTYRQATVGTLLHEVGKMIYNSCESDDDLKAFIKGMETGGCKSGAMSDLTYYSETVPFYNKHEEEIWELIDAHMEGDPDYRVKNRLDFLSKLNGADQVYNLDTFANLLAWFAAEHVTEIIAQTIDLD